MPLQIHKRFIWPAILLLGIILIGTLGYRLIGGSHYSLLDDLYMTIITIATIGYGEIVDLSNNPGGRIFTIFIAIAGIGTLTYVVTNLTANIVEGNLTESYRRRKMEKKIDNYKNHFIICGYGAMGAYIADELNGTSREFIILDTNTQEVAKALQTDEIAIDGDATNNDDLIKAGIERARGLFAVTGDDNQNLVISLTAKHLNPAVRVLARCNDIKNSEKIRRAGADAVVSPGFIGSLRMASEMIRPTVVSFLDMMLRETERNLQVEEVVLPNPFIGKPLSALDLRKQPETLILAIKTKEKWIYNPPRDYLIQDGDILVYISTPDGKELLDKFLSGMPTS